MPLLSVTVPSAARTGANGSNAINVGISARRMLAAVWFLPLRLGRSAEPMMGAAAGAVAGRLA